MGGGGYRCQDGRRVQCNWSRLVYKNIKTLGSHKPVRLGYVVGGILRRWTRINGSASISPFVLRKLAATVVVY